MNERLLEAMDQVSETHIAEAAGGKRHKKKRVLGAIAAVLAVVIFLNLPPIPMAVRAKAVATASESRAIQRPKDVDDPKWSAFSTERQAREQIVEQAVPQLMPFFRDSAAIYMAGAEDNRVWSPINGYIALGMLAELTDGQTRQQVLDALGYSDLEALRTQLEALWESVYREGNEECHLANSLWLDENLSYSQETMDNVAHYHYADIYQADLQSKQAAQALGAWLNNHTGGLLKNHTDQASFPAQAVLALASTVYLQGTWSDEFSPKNNTEEIFHAPSGDRTVTYMNKKQMQRTYYWGDSFGAVALGLKNGTQMWFFLPDEGKTVDDVLAEGQYLDYICPSTCPGENSKYMKINFSVPKFDISSSGDLSQMFQELGITDIFSTDTSDFTAITADSPVFVGTVNQAARVIIDEQGVKAASYIEIPGAGAAMPPEEIIDFILDRPFLFVIASYDGVPLFTGVVNEP